MSITNPDTEEELSPLAQTEVAYIDSEELTDTSELVLPEPLSEKIAEAFHDTVEALSPKSDDE